MEDASSTGENVTDPQSVESVEVVSPKAVGDQCIDELVHRLQAEGLQLTGESGLLQQLTKRLLESALEGEITDHLGYDKQDAAGKNGGNSRNGKRSKTVLIDMGPVEITVPRDRGGSFEPKIAKKRLTGVDEMAFVLLLYAMISSSDSSGGLSSGSHGTQRRMSSTGGFARGLTRKRSACRAMCAAVG
jgi:hypothetical protein